MALLTDTAAPRKAALNYENLSYTDLDALPRDKTLFFISCGPIEQHGPHLPFGTDVMTADFFVGQFVTHLSASHPDWKFVQLPSLHAGADSMRLKGSIEVSARLVRDYMAACCRQIARDGFRHVILVTGHGSPRHLVALEEVASHMGWRHKLRVLAVSSRILPRVLKGEFAEAIEKRAGEAGEKITPDQKKAFYRDLHGGILETSLMLKIRPELVKPDFKDLPPAIVSSLYRLGKNSGKTTAPGLGYLGSPARSSDKIGEAIIAETLNDTLPLLEQFLDGKDVSRKFRSVFYYIPIFRSNFGFLIVLTFYVAILMAGMLYMNRFLTEMFR